MKTRRHHNNDGRQQIKSGTRSLTTQRLARRMGIPFMHRYAKNIHDNSDNERKIISIYGTCAILEHDGEREEWMQCSEGDNRAALIVDGKQYRFVKRIKTLQ